MRHPQTLHPAKIQRRSEPLDEARGSRSNPPKFSTACPPLILVRDADWLPGLRSDQSKMAGCRFGGSLAGLARHQERHRSRCADPPSVGQGALRAPFGGDKTRPGLPPIAVTPTKTATAKEAGSAGAPGPRRVAAPVSWICIIMICATPLRRGV